MQAEETKPLLSLSCSPLLSRIYHCSLENYAPYRQVRPGGYDYDDLNLEEVVILAKTIPEAQDELLWRLMVMLSKYAGRSVNRFPNLDFNLLYADFQETAIEAAKIYEPGRADYLHLLRRMLNFSFRKHLRKSKQEYDSNRKYFGFLVKEGDNSSFFRDSAYEMKPDVIALKLDFEKYLLTLEDEERNLLRMYLEGYTLREISDTFDKKISTVDYKINQLLDAFRKQEFSSERA